MRCSLISLSSTICNYHVVTTQRYLLSITLIKYYFKNSMLNGFLCLLRFRNVCSPFHFNCFASKALVQCRTKPAVLCELSLFRDLKLQNILE